MECARSALSSRGLPALAAAWLALLAPLACESPPPEESRCRTVETETGVVTECQDAPGDDWDRRAMEEAQEGMDERGPDRRPF